MSWRPTVGGVAAVVVGLAGALSIYGLLCFGVLTLAWSGTDNGRSTRYLVCFLASLAALGVSRCAMDRIIDDCDDQ